jgi:biopolymer transport protein TolR
MTYSFSSHSQRTSSRHPVMSNINVTPMVDVMLVLLIIFMVTSPMMLSGVTVDLPETNAKPITASKDPITITLNEQGELFLQDEKITFERLLPTLHTITKHDVKTRLLVRGDNSVDYGQIMRILGHIHEAGYTKVSLITKPETL